jgi:acyl-coenzyme A thioesterase PaaI-like protein
MEHFRKLERMYAAAPINDWFAPQLKVGQGEAEVRIPLRPDFHHAAGAAHGTLYFKAMDDATFFAANSIVEDFFVLTAKFELELLRPVAAGEMYAKARVTGEDDRRIYCQASLYDSEEQLIGRGNGEFARSKMPLTPDVHYR